MAARLDVDNVSTSTITFTGNGVLVFWLIFIKDRAHDQHPTVVIIWGVEWDKALANEIPNSILNEKLVLHSG